MELSKYNELRQRPAARLAQAAMSGTISAGFLEYMPHTASDEIMGIGFGAVALLRLGQAAIERFSPQSETYSNEQSQDL
jgi:hypothetical protein